MRSLVSAVLVALLCAPALAKEPLDLSKPLPSDDRVDVSTLPNGMRVWIRRHGRPEGKVSMLLFIGAGSLQETDAQRGLAHYIEHMAFNGSTNFPPETLIKKFESVGVQFGGGINAFTSFDRVGYMLNLPDVKDETIELGLTFYADVASGLLLTQPELDKERKVILQELRARDEPQMRMMKKMIEELAPGSLASKRMPGGDETVIKTAPREEFVSYYNDWYRPKRATLLIIGDVDPKTMRERVAKKLGGWPVATKPDPVRPPPGIVTVPSLRAALVTDPDLTEASSDLTQVQPLGRYETLGDMRSELVQDLAVSVGRQRLARRLQEGKAPYQAATVMVQLMPAGIQIASAGVESEVARWRASQRALLEEIRRLHVHGVLEDELARAKTSLLTLAEQRVDAADSTVAAQIVQQWMTDVSRGRTPMSQKQSLALARQLLPTITAKEVHERFNQMFSLEAGLLTLSLPEKDAANVDEQELLNVARKVSKSEVEAPTAERAVGVLLQKAPQPGSVVSESKNESLGTTSWVLSNGVAVVVKPIATAGSVFARVGLYGGLLEETAENRGITALAGLAMRPGRAATRRHSPREISEFLRDKKIRVAIGRDEILGTVTVQGSPDDLASGFELAHVLLREGQIDPNSFDAAKRDLLQGLEEARKSLDAQVLRGMRERLAPDDVRMHFSTAEVVKGITREAAQAWLEGIATKAPMEIVITGKIELARAKELVSKYFGSLPKRSDDWDSIRKKRVVKTAKGPIEDTLSVDATTTKALVMSGWTGAAKGDPLLRARLFQAGFIMRGRMNTEIREERGLTYSGNASYAMTAWDGADQFALQFSTDPAKAVEAAKIAREVALDLRNAGPKPEEVASTQMMLGAQIRGLKEQPMFWGQILRRFALEPGGLDGLAKFLEQVLAVDGAAVKAALQDVMQDDRFIQVIGFPKGSEPKKADVEKKDGE